MKYTITNIRKGKGNRSHTLYAQLRDENNELVISATLDYVVMALKDILSKE